MSAAPATIAANEDGAKKRDYWWTVLAIDPLAVPLARSLARRGRVTPDQVTMASLVLGLATGPLYAIGAYWSFVAGAVVYYLSFMLDCVDGKIARLRGISSARGQALDAMADGIRRASAVMGLLWFLLHDGDTSITDLEIAIAFAVLSFYFMDISGAEKGDSGGGARGKWSAALARRRLLPTPGMPDVSAIVYLVGPITTLVVPGFAVGLVMVVVAILLTWRRRLRA
ncbi:MAG TPA: CDP-alcohol phosphatidyltransferase family protein [Actinomycetota bacterium]|nr:CDP-alcohol phosphatidyltransferase family protein [Actinomycetota bacterium]